MSSGFRKIHGARTRIPRSGRNERGFPFGGKEPLRACLFAGKASFRTVLFAVALTRAEIIERFKTPPITKMDGLIQVFAECPADMRREYQEPIASFAYGTCKDLAFSMGRNLPPPAKPGIVISVLDGRTNDTRVISFQRERDDGSRYLRIQLPSPGYSDLEKLRTEVAKGFLMYANGKTPSDADIARELRRTDKRAQADFEYAELERWKNGEAVESDDSGMLRLSRKIITPGLARPADILRFASRLRLYPSTFDVPFCGKYGCCTPREAIELRNRDVRIRFEALKAMSTVVAYGGGRGEDLLAAAQAYSALFLEIARGEKSDGELFDMLDDAETKLNIAMEKARTEDSYEKDDN